MTSQLTTFVSICIPLIFVLGLWLVVAHQKFKKAEENKLQHLFLELSSERNLKKKLESVPTQIESFENITAIKFRTAKVEIANINFSLKEIF